MVPIIYWLYFAV